MTITDRDQPKAPTLDQSGKPVDVVERTLSEQETPDKAFDKVVTPVATKEKEQDAETLREKAAEIERKIADGR